MSTSAKKLLVKISAFCLVFAFIFGASSLVLPQRAEAGPMDVINCVASPFDCALRNIVTLLAVMTLKLFSLLTALGGIVLNGVIFHTIIRMADNYSNLPVISEAWSTIRDVANMGFIFILLYAAIQLILGSGGKTKDLIVKVIIVALLINFSMFFTKLVIDASNVLSITFYGAMVPPESLNPDSTVDLIKQTGLSNAFMDKLGLTSLYKASQQGFGMDAIITVGVMGSVMLLIAAFVFFAAAILLIIRYVVLILVIILSPIAFMAYVLPALDKYKKQWWDALSGQAFFAPIYFMLTWISLKVLDGIMSVGAFSGGDATANLGAVDIATNGAIESQGFFDTFIAFAIVIVFLVISIMTAKEWANKAGSGVSGLTKWAMGAAGGATLGMAGRFGRGTLGRAGGAVADSATVKNMIDRGGMSGAAGRLAMMAGKKSASGSWDLRGTGLNKQLQAGKAKKGGFSKDEKDRNKAAAQRAKDQKPSDREAAQLAEQTKRAEEQEEAALKTAGYKEHSSLAQARRAVEYANNLKRQQGESREDFAERKARVTKTADDMMERAQKKDRSLRVYYERSNMDVAKAVRAREQAQEEEKNAHGRPNNYAEKQTEPTITLPNWVRRRNQTAESISREGVGGYAADKIQGYAQRARDKGYGRAGGFLDTVARAAGLRREERERRAAAARNYKKTLEDAEKAEFTSKVKKALEKDEEDKGEEKPAAPPGP